MVFIYYCRLKGRFNNVKKNSFRQSRKRLLDLMINSTYTHKEIFLREIISNASDALDKLCYLSLTDEIVGMSRNDFRIDVKTDKDARTITVSDNGIGMTEEEMEKNLGVIANSGSFKFKKDLAQDEKDEKEIDIIGSSASASIPHLHRNTDKIAVYL